MLSISDCLDSVTGLDVLYLLRPPEREPENRYCGNRKKKRKEQLPYLLFQNKMNQLVSFDSALLHRLKNKIYLYLIELEA